MYIPPDRSQLFPPTLWAAEKLWLSSSLWAPSSDLNGREYNIVELTRYISGLSPKLVYSSFLLKV